MAFYIFKSGICLAIFYGFYKLVLEKESFHIFKRFYLLFSAVFAFAIPLITFKEYIEVIPQEVPVFLPEMTVTNTIVENEHLNYTPIILWSIYAIGVLLFSIKFLKNLLGIIFKIKKNPKFKNHSFVNVLLQDLVIPHTFFNYIFLNKQKFETQQIPKEVLLHEETHAKQKHSLDVLFIEILQILFWFNPFIYLLKRSIKLNHEFLADQAVINKGILPSTYQQILLAFSSNATEQLLANAINYSSIKKRFTVMKTQTSKQAIWLRSLILLPLLAILIYSFSEKKIVEKETNEPFKIQQNVERNGVPEAMMKEYRDFILNTERTNMIVYPKYIRAVAIYDLMTDEQRNSVKKYPKNLIPNLSDVKPKTPTEEVFNSWKDSNEFAIWIDGKHVKNSELDNYKVSDIKYFTTSFVYNNARSNKFPQPYQNNLYTQKGFETTFTNAKKDNSALEQIKKELEINSNLNKPEPVLEISFNPDIFRLNGKDTSLQQLKEDFIAVVNNEKSDLNIKSKGGINMSLINKIMAELKGNLIKIHLDEEAYIIEDGLSSNETVKINQQTDPIINDIHILINEKNQILLNNKLSNIDNLLNDIKKLNPNLTAEQKRKFLCGTIKHKSSTSKDLIEKVQSILTKSDVYTFTTFNEDNIKKQGLTLDRPGLPYISKEGLNKKELALYKYKLKNYKEWLRINKPNRKLEETKNGYIIKNEKDEVISSTDPNIDAKPLDLKNSPWKIEAKTYEVTEDETKVTETLKAKPNNNSSYNISQVKTTSIVIDADTLDELKIFDWNSLTDIFKDNNPNTIISLEFNYNKPVMIGDSKSDTFHLEVKDKTSELEKMINKVKKIISSLKPI